MAYILRDGFEVDEQGYLREAVEGWAKHGIYPPPIVGSPHRPEVVKAVRSQHARLAKLSPQERERHFETERRFMSECLTALVSPPSSSS